MSISTLAFMYLYYLCISFNLTWPCCRLQRLNHIHSLPESSCVYYCNTKMFGQVFRILLCFVFSARMTFNISIKIYQLQHCDLLLKDSASRSSEQELIADYKFFRLSTLLQAFHTHTNLNSHAVTHFLFRVTTMNWIHQDKQRYSSQKST